MKLVFCHPCLVPLFQAYFPQSILEEDEDAEYLVYDLADLSSFKKESDIYNDPPDFPTREEEMKPVYQQMGLSIEEFEFSFPFDSPFRYWCPDDNLTKYHPDPRT